MAVYNQTTSGGLLGAGLSKLSLRFSTISSTGGILASGAINDSLVTISLGGAKVGSSAIKETPVLHYPNTLNAVNPRLLSSSTFIVSKIIFNSEGGLTTDGSSKVKARYRYITDGKSADAGPNFSGINVGYFNDINPTLVSQNVNFNYDFSWRSDSYAQSDFDFVWNTGKIRQYWYRIVGKAKSNTCPPLDVGEPCCMRMITNVQARSVNDLCKKLKERNWNWPIEKVQKFNKPAENSEINADAALGIFYDCNQATDIEICNNVICKDFCIDYDLVENWVAYSNSQIRKSFSYLSNGSAYLNGVSSTSYLQNHYLASYSSVGEITLSGQARIISSHYDVNGTDGVVLNGLTTYKSSHYDFIGGVYPFSTNSSNPINNSVIIENSSDQIWNLPERVYQSDNLYSICDVSFLQSSHLLVASNFGFNIPENHSVIGIEANVERNSIGTVKDLEVFLVLDGQIVSDNMAKPNLNWPVTIDSIVTYGSRGTRWRSDSNPWDINDINSPGFGLGIRVKGFSNTTGVLARIDNITLKIYYAVAEQQLIRINGSSRIRCSTYKQTSTGGLTLNSINDPLTSIDRKYNDLGMGEIGPLFASLTIGGYYQPRFSQVSSGLIQLNGGSVSKSSYRHYTATDGLGLSGESKTKSSNYHYRGFGLVNIDSTNIIKNASSYKANGDLQLSSDSNVVQRYYYNPVGEINLIGSPRIVSSAFKWKASGSISIANNQGYDIVDVDNLIEYVGFDATVQDLLFVYAESNTPTNIIVPTKLLNKCNCINLPLSIFYSHNLFSNNKFEQFLNRNNITLPTNSNLLYNKINDSWQSNTHLTGFSPNSISKEKWNIVFDLQCTNVIGGKVVGQRVWKLTAQIIQKLPSADYDTRILIGFLPDQVCAGNEFKLSITLDSLTGQAIASNNVTIYQNILYDNIGLFKNAYWINNPNILFSISQNGTTSNSPRYVLNI